MNDFDNSNVNLILESFQDFRWNDRVPERGQEFRDQRFEVQEGLQRCSHRRGDKSLAVHHTHEKDLPHRLSW